MAEAGELVLLRFAASHFLWKMVRRLVGTLVRVGTGQLGEDAFAALLAGAGGGAGRGEGGGGKADDPARWTAPPSGLFLERVLYAGRSAVSGRSARGLVTPV